MFGLSEAEFGVSILVIASVRIDASYRMVRGKLNMRRADDLPADVAVS